MTDSESPDFEDWLAELASSAEDRADPAGRTPATMRPGALAHLREYFEAHGAMTRDELSELLDADSPRLDELRLQACQELLPAVLADAASSGVTDLEVAFSVNPDSPSGGLIMVVRHPAWGSPHWYGDNEPDGPGPAPGWDADALAWIATGIQEACLLGPRPGPPQFLPLCPHHGAGVHAHVSAGVAVWWCAAASGHVVAPVGALRSPQPT